MNEGSVSFEEEKFEFVATERSGLVSGIVVHPRAPAATIVLGHGAGAGMKHSFMEDLSGALAGREILTLRYQFPYMEKGRRRPDFPATLKATVRSAIEEAHRRFPGLPLFAGGKSMGGRMTSRALAARPDSRVGGVVFFGFPLHPAGKPSIDRAEHLADLAVPALFLQGTRDKLAGLDLLEPVVERLGSRGMLHVVDGADHGFHVLKRSGRTDDEVLEEIVETAARWMVSEESL